MGKLNAKSAYLVIAHGSRESRSNKAYLEVLEQLRKKLSDRPVQEAFLELAKPSIPEAIQNCVEKGITEIFVVPLMLFPGRHVREHIPQIIQDAKEQYPELDFHYSGPLSENQNLVGLIADIAQKATTSVS